MELFGTLTSPYTRIVRIIAAEVGIQYNFNHIKWRESPQELFNLNPAGKVPVLIDGVQYLTESLQICDYLMEHDTARANSSFRPLNSPHRWEEGRIRAIITAAMDSHSLLRFFSDPPTVTHPYLERCLERIHKCFAALDQIASQGYLVEPEGFGMAEGLLITAMDTIEGRQHADIGAYPNCQALRSKYQGRTSIIITTPAF